MPNNIAAIMRTDVKAVDVRFLSGKSNTYTYLTTFAVAVDDFVVVPIADETFKVARVHAVKPAELDPNDELTYKYIVHAFNLDAYNKVLTENEEIERLIAGAQRASMRNAFANAVLANVDTNTRAARAPYQQVTEPAHLIMTQPTLPLIIYHDNCADGFGAAWAAYKKFGADGAEYLPMGYNDPRVKLKQIKFADPVLDFPVPIAGRDVYILAQASGPDIIDAMLGEANSVTWIDHHKTAFEAFNFNATEPVHIYDPELNWEVILNPNKSGCVLAWEHFHPGENIPWLLRYIEDRDLWRWGYISTRYLATGLRSKPFTFKWFDYADKNLNYVMNKGTAMNELFDQQLADITKKHIPTLIEGQLGRSVNCTPQFASEAGNILAQASGTFGMTWMINSKGMANVSLRSIGDYDVSAIAKTFGGGGHRNAAGFEVAFDRLKFIDGVLHIQ